MALVIRLGPGSTGGDSSAAIGPDLLDGPCARLAGAALRWKRYRGWTSPRLPGECEFCRAPFTDGGAPGLNSGYSVVGGGPAGQDDYAWICAVCYEINRDRFGWTVLDTREGVWQPPDLLAAAIETVTWRDPRAPAAPESSPPSGRRGVGPR